MNRIFAIFLTMLMLASNSGVVFATHYCMGEVSDLNIGFSIEAQKCIMSSKEVICAEHIPKEGAVSPMDCCDDSYFQIQINDSYKNSIATVTNLDAEFFVAFTLVYLNLCTYQPTVKADYADYSPPLLKQDIPVLFQSFLI